ncbi:enoyl-CoA hydratase-related protein [Neobacillus rhizophilus]|uniref:Enoyl-CoA hydratase/isomerase family protein n=1 Tax=Neobacillus rhizophilus TaxID=2833579 RepID=A0A942U9A3_9BACI|nr:enoyl-CoA hydratase-related protein [Neobacillus rhizophilus]MBS4214967.1 enoyl-CoA hydratase/isomerase family protein [Neobacillus rhizophilus]
MVGKGEMKLNYQYLDVSIEDNIAKVTLKRPPVNAVNQDMYRELKEAFENLGKNDYQANVAVLTSEGKVFCAGNDLNEFITMTPENGIERMREVREAFWAIYDCEIPVIAAVNGAALGTGFALAASCDLIIASENAKFALPEINVGVLGGAKFGARIVPEMVMRRMYFTGEALSVQEISKYGAITEITSPENLLAVSLDWARKIGSKSPRAIKMARKSLNGCEYMDLKEGYKFEQQFTCELSGYEEAKEAVRAVIEKRKPAFKGV